MEARASYSGASVSKTFVAAILVIVAMCLAAVGGYIAKGLTSGGAAPASQSQTFHLAPGTVLRQDYAPSGTSSVVKDDHYSAQPAGDKPVRQRGGVQ